VNQLDPRRPQKDFSSRLIHLPKERRNGTGSERAATRNSAISAFGKRQEMSRVLIPRLDSLFEATSKRSAAQQFRCIRAVFSAKKLMFA